MNKFTEFFKRISRKHRLSLRSEHKDSELWYMHIRPIELWGGLLALVLVVFLVMVILVSYTPILEYVPGYKGNRQRDMLMQNIARIDSLERVLNDIEVYTSDISTIMDGKTPVTRDASQIGDSVQLQAAVAVVPNAADSALRSQLEGDGIYSLASTQSPARGERGGLQLVAPVKGIISAHFDPNQNSYGIGIATPDNQPVMAVAGGTVILSVWTPDEGSVIQIQHSDNLISVYKRCSQAQHAVGARVRAGEVIGYTGEGASGEGTKGLFLFELWHNGTAINPEGYIVF